MIKELYDENCVLHSLLVCDMPAKFIPCRLMSILSITMVPAESRSQKKTF